jgi:Bacterial Ig-like domain (group 3)
MNPMYGGHTFKTRALLIAALLALPCATPVLAVASTPGSAVSAVYEFSGAPEPFVVPAGVGAIGVNALGANGGYGGIFVGLIDGIPHDFTSAVASAAPAADTHERSFAPGGSGGETSASIPVSAGQTLIVNVGGAGESSRSPTRGYGGPGGVKLPSLVEFTPPMTPGAAGGYGGGGEGGGSEHRYEPEWTGLFFGGGGGGASSVSLSGTPLLIAGGGGGGGGNGGGRNSSDAVQVQPDTLYERSADGGGGMRATIANLNVGDLAIVSLNWVAYEPNDMPATPEGWTLLDSAEYGEVGELGNAYGTRNSGVSYAYVATYVRRVTEPGTEESLFIAFPHRSTMFNMLGFGVSGTDPNEPVSAHQLVIDTSRSGNESFPAIPVARDHSAVLSITSFPVDLPSSVVCPPASPGQSPLDSGTFGELDYFCSKPPPGAVSYANDVSSGMFPAVTANWPGYTDALAGEEIVLQPPAGGGGNTGPVSSSGGAGGGSDAESGAGETGVTGTIDTAESERGLGGAGGSESTPELTEIGEPGQSDDSSDDPRDDGGFTGGGGGGGYYGGLGGAFAMCDFEPCAVRGAGGGGGGSNYAEASATAVHFARAANSSTSGNGQVTITYYTPYPTETSASARPPSNQGESTVTLTAEVNASGPCGGQIQFTIDGKDVGAPVTVSANVAETSVSTPAVGMHTVNAVYSGELSTATQAGCLPSTSEPSTLSVLYPTSTQATPTPSSASVGETITITATVTSTITCTGTVQFEIDGKPIGNPIPVTDGKAQTTIPAPAAGQHPITATYSGTPSTATQTGCLPSTSAPSTLSVGSAKPSATITAEGLVVAKRALACESVRRFVIHLQIPRRQRLTGTNVYVDGRLVKHLGPTTRAYLLNLRGRPYSTVTITLTAREPDGHLISGKRTYHTCRPHPLPGHTRLHI